uniref:Helicase swr1-like n=1 Tax=Dermatophagoides pteronyssinus TaxID=6956 RepID=A0A6P6XNX9_DERPT|nr:helicase swr1-like [Dermatophagoides pteronyssinus]
MGLGKTVQTITLLSHLASEKGIWGPHIIIVPSSVLYNWQQEFLKFAPGLNVFVYAGSKKTRALKRQGMYKKFAFNVLVTTYKIAVLDSAHLRRMSYYYMVLDEAHVLKNFAGIQWNTIFRYSYVHRLLLTGTPLQNNLMELWSLMYMIIPEVFGNHADFDRMFNSPLLKAIKNNEANESIVQSVQHLYSALRPFFLRRLKSQVEKELPKKTERVVRCKLTNKQIKLYNDLISAYDKSARNSQKGPSVLTNMSLILNLRRVCNHPSLIEESFIDSTIFYKFLNLSEKNFIDVKNPLLFDKAINEETSTKFKNYHSILTDKQFKASDISCRTVTFNDFFTTHQASTLTFKLFEIMQADTRLLRLRETDKNFHEEYILTRRKSILSNSMEDKKLDIIHSAKTKPRVIKVWLKNGYCKKVLIKGGEDDVRQDSLILRNVAYLRIVTNEKHLGTYNIVPVNFSLGLIQFLDMCISLKDNFGYIFELSRILLVPELIPIRVTRMFTKF